jgi:hypothetical protein
VRWRSSRPHLRTTTPIISLSRLRLRMTAPVFPLLIHL